jgi:DNA polymerase
MYNVPRIDFFNDVESQSELDLTVVGAVKYATHHSTRPTLMTYCFGRNTPVKVWRPGLEPIPQDLLDVALHPERYNFIAWNVFFDYLIWICSTARLYIGPQFKRPDLAGIHDAMAHSCHFRTGASLEAAAKICKLPMNKDPDGRRIMLKQSKPGKDGKFPALTPEEWVKFVNYGIMDTRLLRDIYYMLPPLPEPERYAWEWTFRRNLEGINVDMSLVRELKAIVDAALPGVECEFYQLTGCKVNSPTKTVEFFKQYYPWIENMRADTMREMLGDPTPVPPHVRRALELKDLAGGAAVSKLRAALNTEYIGKIFELLAYHKAQTKRFAGLGIQIHNYPRVDKKRPDSLNFNMNVEDLTLVVRHLRPGLKDPMGFVKNLLRRMWVPTKGLHFYCGDFSKVEPSVLFWLTGKGSIPKLWYETTAAAIYNRQVHEIEDGSEERTVGKMANLSCQYGTGWEGYQRSVFKDTGIRLGEEMSKRVVNTYRQLNPEITQFWSDLETSFRMALYGQTTALCNGKLHVMPMAVANPSYKGVAIRLPSGSYLYYHDAEEILEISYETAGKDNKSVKISEATYKMLPPIEQVLYRRREKRSLRYMSDLGRGSVGWKYVYGGLLCENVTSATARDILLPAMWRLEHAGFSVLATVHDELWGEAGAGRDDEFKHLMCINPSWCDMEIGSDLKVGVRYLK